jgi:phosphatidylserine/phosphatidylglycerophosphate/cardiolipin synthase-like enzyme
MMSELEKAICRIVDNCAEKTVESVIELIESGSANQQTTIYDWTRLLKQEYIATPMLVDFVDSWANSTLSSEGLAFGLRTALNTKQRMAVHAPEIELVWTGPYPPSSGNVRSTFAVMQEMMAGAQKSVFLVGYSLTSSTSFPLMILEQLVSAKRRGCDIKVALHNNNKNHRHLKHAWPTKLMQPTLLRWVGNKDDMMASLHAKMLLIDRKELLVTSANLTHHGLSSNIEVGVRIKGNIANQMANHFISLERAGVLQRTEWS